MKRYGQVIGIKPEKLAEYTEAHANVWPEVLDMISQCNMRNYSIYRYNNLLFAYFEYHGEDFEADAAKMAAHAKTQEWWDWMMPMQEPVAERAEGEWWHDIEEVFHHD
ncbi:MAG: L-rhamnose mutarotase [Chloroflexota bacterium]